MKTTKTSKTNTSRLVFFTIALTYNLILGFCLRDFLILSPTLHVFYLLSVLPTSFLAVRINSKAMRATVYISLILIACINTSYAIYCRRAFPILAIISLGIVFMYFIAFLSIYFRLQTRRRFSYKRSGNLMGYKDCGTR